MRPLRRTYPLVVLFGLSGPLACSGDDSGASGTATTSTSAATPSTGAETASTSSGSTTSAGSESASSTATTKDESTSSDTATTGDTAAPGDTAGAGDPAAPGTTTGGGGELCDDVGEVDFGDCQTPLGWIFDGAGCVPLSGCDCGDHCDAVFQDAPACAGSCAAAGECNKELLLGSGLARGPYGVGDICDDFAVCGDSSGSVAELIPTAMCSPGAKFPCEEGPSCSISSEGEITEERFEQLCAASLLPDVNLVSCLIWGP